VVESSSAEEALGRFPAAAAPDLVITDIVLPGKSGLNLIGDLRKQFPEIRIVAMSGALDSDVPALLRQSREMGASYGLPKPFTTAQLLEAVESALSSPVAPGPIADSAERKMRLTQSMRWSLLAVLVVLLVLMFAMAMFRR
jgi:DNA-binding NarL/FixJ family response regulator